MGSGFLLAALGVLVVGLIQMIQGQAPAFGATDLLFLTTYVMIMAGLIRLPHVRNDLTHRLRIVVDAVRWGTFDGHHSGSCSGRRVGESE